MRPTSIGPVKHLLRRINLEKLNDILSLEIERGSSSVRPAVEKYIKSI
jgi:phosphotransferase system enzyme I (PtsP)